MNALKGLGISMHLANQPEVELSKQSTCVVFKIKGESSLYGLDLYLEKVEQIDALMDGLAKARTELATLEEATVIISRQADRIAELEQKLASQPGVQERSASGGAA